jgi:hypothetical protein
MGKEWIQVECCKYKFSLTNDRITAKILTGRLVGKHLVTILGF